MNTRFRFWKFLVVPPGVAGLLLALALLAEEPKTPAPEPAQSDVSPAEYLRRHVNFLTSIEPPRNHLHIASLDRAADYIADKLRETSETVRFQEYPVEGKTYKNVIAMYPGTADERIVIGAHYDVAGDGPGADDNASGVAVMLELAFLIKERKPQLPYPVELVAYSLEEPPYFRTKFMGSAIHAKSLADAQTPVSVMIALDCVGYYTDTPGSQNFPLPGMTLLYPDKGNFLGVIGKFGQGSTVSRVKRGLLRRARIQIETITAPASLVGVDFSDHMNYWKHDYNAVLLSDTAFYRNHNYHKPTDRPDTLDYEKMVQVAEGLYGLITNWGGKKKSG